MFDATSSTGSLMHRPSLEIMTHLLLHFHSVTYVCNSLFICLCGTLGGLYHFLTVPMNFNL